MRIPQIARLAQFLGDFGIAVEQREAHLVRLFLPGVQHQGRMSVHPGIPVPVSKVLGGIGVHGEKIGADPIVAQSGRLVDAFE